MEPFGAIIAATELGSLLGGAIADLVEKSVKKAQLSAHLSELQQAWRMYLRMQIQKDPLW